MSYRRILCFIATAFLFECQAAPQQSPQAPTQGGLADASLEELMNIEVTSVSKKAQTLSSTAASVYVITSEDIRRSGITVLPELLRLAPGVEVSRLSSGTWAIGIRGFNDEFSNKLLVLVDGRSVYNVFYTGVLWNTLNMPVEDIERIEVIRGPGAAMWGTNAVNGVINIITRNSKLTKGLVVDASGSGNGSQESVRFGDEIGSSADYRIGAQNLQFDPLAVVGAGSPSRGWISREGSFRVDFDPTSSDSVMLSGGMYESNLGMLVPVATPDAPNAPLVDDRALNVGGNVVATWRHIISETSDIQVNVSFERLLYDDPQSTARINVSNLSFQHHIRAGARHDIIYGISFRDSSYLDTPGPFFAMAPARDQRTEKALFAQDEIALVPGKLQFIAGAQVSETEGIGYQVQPTGRLLWTPTESLSSWVAVSRAERLVSLDETGLSLYQLGTPIPSGLPSMPYFSLLEHIMGSSAARSETVLAYEAGQRVKAARHMSFDVSSFYNVYHHLASFTPGAPTFLYTASGAPYIESPVVAGNERHGDSYGMELPATWNPSSRWKLVGGYNWLRVTTRDYPGDSGTDELRIDNPNHQWQARSYFDLTRHVQLDSALCYTSAMQQIGIPQHLRGDLRLGWRPAANIELSAGVQDAFEARHVEFESTRFDQTSVIPRQFYVHFPWRF